MGRPRKYIDNQRFGCLEVTGQVRKATNGSYEHLCRCDCGNETWVRLDALTSGGTKSCGCAKGQWKRLESGVAARNEVLSYYKKSAQCRNLDWALSEQEFDDLILASCFYCGRTPYNVRYTRQRTDCITYTGIDRLDNQQGYTVDNTVACCKICNRAKRDMSLNAFLNWIQDLARFVHEQDRNH
jgi:hypothetical protein